MTFADSVSATAPNYTAQCLAAQQAHVTALAIFDTVPPMERLAQDCAKQGYDPIYVIEGGSFTTALTSTRGSRKICGPNIRTTLIGALILQPMP